MSVAAAVRGVVDKAPTGTFIRSSDIDGPRSGVDTALCRLNASGELVRVRNGLYWKGVKSRYGSGRPNLIDAAIAASRAGAGPAGWSATHLLGLSTQMPAVPEVAVAGPAPVFPGVRFHRRNNLDRRDLNPTEIAVLEVLRAWPAHSEVGPDELVRRIAELEADGKVRIEVVRAVARLERSTRLRQNIGLLSAP